MKDQAHEPRLADAIRAALAEQAGAERYRLSQRQVRSGRPRAESGPHPLEFDANGFPVRERSPSFATRVARLLNPL